MPDGDSNKFNMKKHYYLLAFIVLLAFIIRMLFVWIDRPEFVGWFNHTYYYYIQTKGLIENGKLPFNDMPFLFYLYAITSKALMSFGVEASDAVVTSSRFWMTLVPSLLPIPVYRTLRKVSPDQEIPDWSWLLITMTAFYPLSLSYLPEFLQKNALGLLLLAIFIDQSINISVKANLKSLTIFSGVFLLITFTHYGTAGASILYCTALATSIILYKNKKTGIKVLIGGLIGLAVSLYFINLFDTQRFDRVIFYINRTFDTSPLGITLHSSSDIYDRITGISLTIIPIGLIYVLYLLFIKNKSTLPPLVRVFWIGNLFFTYLLVLPIYDQLLLGRFSLYLPLPLFFILFLILQYSSPGVLARRIVLVLSVIFVTLMSLGEFMSLKFHNRNAEEAFADLTRLRAEIKLTDADLIIGRNGVEHISNWFLGTKSCVITAFNRNDFNKYSRVFILNPTESGMIIREKIDKELDRYNLMLSNVPIPKTGKEVFSTPQLKLIQIAEPPAEWIFDNVGTWKRYKD